MNAAQPPLLLIGARPPDGRGTLKRLGVPFILVTDPSDPLPDDVSCAVDVWSLPFKDQPLSVLSLSGRGRFSAVVSFTELGLLPAALLAECLSVPGTPVRAVLRSRNKLQMRSILAGQIPQPAFGVVGTDTPDRYPVVLKPVDGSGSRGISWIADAREFAERCPELCGFLWESYVAGREFSVETVSHGDGHHVIGITEKFTTGAPHFVETGHLAPAPLSEFDRHELVTGTVRALTLLGVDRCAAHTELKLAGGHAVIIETHTRPGGDRIPRLHRLVTGQDQFALGLPPQARPALAPEEPRFPCVGVRYFRWPDGVLADVDGLAEAREVPGLVELTVTATPGDRLSVWRHSQDRPGHCLVGGDSPEQVRGRLDEVERQLRVRYRPPHGRDLTGQPQQAGSVARPVH
jgi:biotin carboxylase